MDPISRGTKNRRAILLFYELFQANLSAQQNRPYCVTKRKRLNNTPEP